MSVAKQRRRGKVQRAQVQVSLDRLCQTVTATWPNDEWRPNVTVSWIDTDRVFYASIVRYPDGEYSKVVEFKARARELDVVIADLAVQFDRFLGAGASS